MLQKFLVGVGVVAVCALIAVAFFFYYMHRTNAIIQTGPLPDFPNYRAKTIRIDGQQINVAIADTPQLQELGLGNRDGMGADEGMLFIFQQDSEYAFWMKDMYFSIDMVWISSASKIVYIASNVSPQTYPEDFAPTSPARYVLELHAGYAQAHGFKVGDTVQF